MCQALGQAWDATRLCWPLSALRRIPSLSIWLARASRSVGICNRSFKVKVWPHQPLQASLPAHQLKIWVMVDAEDGNLIDIWRHEEQTEQSSGPKLSSWYWHGFGVKQRKSWDRDKKCSWLSSPDEEAAWVSSASSKDLKSPCCSHHLEGTWSLGGGYSHPSATSPLWKIVCL